MRSMSMRLRAVRLLNVVFLLGLTPAIAGPVAEGRATAADGLEIAWESRGTGRSAVVLVHCWACNRDFWDSQ